MADNVRPGGQRDRAYRRALEYYYSAPTPLFLIPGGAFQDDSYQNNAFQVDVDLQYRADNTSQVSLASLQTRLYYANHTAYDEAGWYQNLTNTLHAPPPVFAPVAGGAIESGANTIATELPPRGYPYPSSNRTHVAYGQPLLIGSDRIYGAPGQAPTYSFSNDLPPRGYPQPSSNRSHFDQHSNTTLYGQDRIWYAPGEAPTYDWIVPKGYRIPISLKVWADDHNDDTLLGQDKFLGGPGQAITYVLPNPPIGPKVPNAARTQLEQLPAQATLLLQGWFNQAQAAITQRVPWAALFLENRTYVQSSPPTLTTIVAAPAQNADLSNPLRPAPRQSYAAPTPIQLVGQDAIYGEPGQAVGYDAQALPPRPYARANALITELDRTSMAGQDAVYGAAGQAPTYVLPNPVLPIRARQDHVDFYAVRYIGHDKVYGTDGQAVGYDAQALPPKGYARANALLTELDRTPTVGHDVIYAADGEVPSYDWPNPRGYPYPVAERTHLHGFALVLNGQDRIYSAPGEVPTYDWIVPKGYPFPLENRTYVQQQSNTLLLSQDALPVGETSFDTELSPKPYARAISLRAYEQNLSNTLLLGQDALPVGEATTDTELPPRGPAPLNRGFVSYVTPLLLAHDKIYAGDGQVPSYDWQAALPPRPYARSIELRTHVLNLSEIPLLSQDALVSGQSSQRADLAPKGYAYPTENRTWLYQTSNTVLLGQDALPVGETTFDTELPPRGYARSIDLRTYVQNLSNSTLLAQDALVSGQANFRTELPPRGYPFPAENRTWLYALINTTLTFVQPPLSVYDYPNPNRTHANPDFYKGVQLELIGQDAVYGAPGQAATYLLPNPTPYPRAVDLRTSLARTSLAGQDVIYAAPGQAPAYDYPNPIRRAVQQPFQQQFVPTTPPAPTFNPDYPNPIRAYSRPDYVAATPPLLLAVPFGPYDYPNPRGAKSNPSHVHASDVQLVGQDRIYDGPGKVATYDWQLPIPYARAIELRTQVLGLVTTTLLGQDALPVGRQSFATANAPRGYAYPELRGFVAYVEPRLIGQESFYGDKGQVPTHVLPNPRLHEARFRVVQDHALPLNNALTLTPPTFYGAPGQAVTYSFQNDLPPRPYPYPISLRGLSDFNDTPFWRLFVPKRLTQQLAQYDYYAAPLTGVYVPMQPPLEGSPVRSL